MRLNAQKFISEGVPLKREFHFLVGRLAFRLKSYRLNRLCGHFILLRAIKNFHFFFCLFILYRILAESLFVICNLSEQLAVASCQFVTSNFRRIVWLCTRKNFYRRLTLNIIRSLIKNEAKYIFHCMYLWTTELLNLRPLRVCACISLLITYPCKYLHFQVT